MTMSYISLVVGSQKHRVLTDFQLGLALQIQFTRYHVNGSDTMLRAFEWNLNLDVKSIFSP